MGEVKAPIYPRVVNGLLTVPFIILCPNLVKFGVRDLNVMLLLVCYFLKNRHRQGSGFRVGIDQNTLTRFTVKSYCIVTVKKALLKPVNYCMLMSTFQRKNSVSTRNVHFSV
jgi:hypothetical protein